MRSVGQNSEENYIQEKANFGWVEKMCWVSQLEVHAASLGRIQILTASNQLVVHINRKSRAHAKQDRGQLGSRSRGRRLPFLCGFCYTSTLSGCNVRALCFQFTSLNCFSEPLSFPNQRKSVIVDVDFCIAYIEYPNPRNGAESQKWVRRNRPSCRVIVCI